MMLVAQIAGLEMEGLQNWKTQEGKLMVQRSQGSGVRECNLRH